MIQRFCNWQDKLYCRRGKAPFLYWRGRWWPWNMHVWFDYIRIGSIHYPVEVREVDGKLIERWFGISIIFKMRDPHTNLPSWRYTWHLKHIWVSIDIGTWRFNEFVRILPGKITAMPSQRATTFFRGKKQ
jgi:hypothetical protein